MIYRDIRCAENPEDILPSLADLSRYPLVTAVESCGFFESIPLWAVTLIGGLFITILSFIRCV